MRTFVLATVSIVIFATAPGARKIAAPSEELA